MGRPESPGRGRGCQHHAGAHDRRGCELDACARALGAALGRRRADRCELGVGGEGAWLSRRAAAGSAGTQEDRAEGSGEGVTSWL
eukprot:scaffold20032_cov96-Isochrysis_galbana.AAC.5